MNANGKVIWREGMFLQPQHFQQAERYFLNVLQARFGMFNLNGYGFTSCTLNAEALQNGNLAVSRCSGIMPDGTPFDLPKDSDLPPVRQIAEFFTHETQTLDVFLCLPLNIEGKANVTSAGQSQFSAARFSGKTESITDDVQGIQKKDVELAVPNFIILSGTESRDNFSSLHIAKLVRNSAGQIVQDETHVPPVLQIGSSPHIMKEMRSLLEILLAKSASLSQGRRQKASGLAEFKSSEETAFRLLQTINTYAPLINHSHYAQVEHPYSIFTLLTQFAGALSVFSSEVSIRQLPKYDHGNLKDVFGIFMQIIKTILGADVSAGCVSIPIEKTGSTTYACRIADEKLLKTSKFYFGVSAAVPEKELLIGTLQRIKMCSRDRLELLIPSAMPGLPMIHTPKPPDGLSTKPGFIYFSLDQGSEFWKGIITSGSLAFYFPNNFAELKMEVLALRE